MREDHVPEPNKIVIFRVLQEALNNVAKYSNTKRVYVTLGNRSGRIELVIEDDGNGFNVQGVTAKNSDEKGMGLTGMGERTELSGGTLRITSIIGQGTRVQASWLLLA